MTEIPYLDFTLNYQAGCTQIGHGCKNCYALTMSNRLMSMNPTTAKKYHDTVYKNAAGELCFTGQLNYDMSVLQAPLKRKKPAVYGVNFMSDTFHAQALQNKILELFTMMDRCQQHTFKIFTKRPHTALDFLKKASNYWNAYPPKNGKILPNVHIYVSVSTQKEADELIPILHRIPAAYRGISFEPAISKIDFSILLDFMECKECGNVARGKNWQLLKPDQCPSCGSVMLPKNAINHLIAGCESGPQRRQDDIMWYRNAMQQCKDAGVPFYMKQINDGGIVRKNLADFPADLRVREL